jgi:hypothetical protein
MKRTLIALVCAAIGWMPATGAFAYKIINNTKDPTSYSIEVWGEHCPRCYHGHVKQGDPKSCPGGEKGCGGHTEITACVLARSAQFGANENSLRSCSVKVPAHGTVEFIDVNPAGIWSTDAYVGCIVYDENDKVINPGNSSMSAVGGYNSCQ